MRDLLRRIAGAGVGRAYALLISILTLVLTARWLGPEGRGSMAAVLSWVTLFSMFTYLNLGQVAVHRAARLRGESWLAPVLGSLLALTVAVTALGWGLAFGVYRATGGSVFGTLGTSLLAVGFLAFPFVVWEGYGNPLLMAVDAEGAYTRAQVVGRTLGLVLTALLILKGWGVAGALAAHVVGQFTVALIGLQHLVTRAHGSLWPRRDVVKELLTGGVKLYATAVGVFLIYSADVLVINYFRGVEAVGYYQLAVQGIMSLLVIVEAAALVLYGRVANEGPDGAWPAQRNVILLFIIGNVGVGAVAAALVPHVLPLVVGPAFTPTVGVFHVLVFALVGMTVSALMAPQWIGRGLFGWLSTVVLGTGLLNVTLNLLLVPRYGMYGAAWSTLTSFAVSLVVNLGFALGIERRVAKNARTKPPAPGGPATDKASKA